MCCNPKKLFALSKKKNRRRRQREAAAAAAAAAMAAESNDNENDCSSGGGGGGGGGDQQISDENSNQNQPVSSSFKTPQTPRRTKMGTPTFNKPLVTPPKTPKLGGRNKTPRHAKSNFNFSPASAAAAAAGNNSTVSRGGVAATPLSSPSRMKTVDLTELFEVPSANYATPEEVVTANGYEIGPEIGRGSYAVVYRARRVADDFVVACKVMQLASSSRNANLSAKNELFILERTADHPHIIKLFKHFIVDYMESSRLVYIFMQYAEGDTLSAHMRKSQFGMPETVSKRMFAQMISAVNHMHGKGIAHRDLKMGNVLLDKAGNVLVTDFGLSRVAFRRSKGGMVMSNKFCGTIPYMAPEILLTKDYSVEYNQFVADIWALGVILFCIVNRGYPFPENDRMLDQQMAHRIYYSKKVSFTPDATLTDLFYRLLEPNVEARIRMPDLMTHPWMAAEVRQVEEKVKQEATNKRITSPKAAENENSAPVDVSISAKINE